MGLLWKANRREIVFSSQRGGLLITGDALMRKMMQNALMDYVRPLQVVNLWRHCARQTQLR
jgi:hypothetical protein